VQVDAERHQDLRRAGEVEAILDGVRVEQAGRAAHHAGQAAAQAVEGDVVVAEHDRQQVPPADSAYGGEVEVDELGRAERARRGGEVAGVHQRVLVEAQTRVVAEADEPPLGVEDRDGQVEIDAPAGRLLPVQEEAQLVVDRDRLGTPPGHPQQRRRGAAFAAGSGEQVEVLVEEGTTQPRQSACPAQQFGDQEAGQSGSERGRQRVAFVDGGPHLGRAATREEQAQIAWWGADLAERGGEDDGRDVGDGGAESLHQYAVRVGREHAREVDEPADELAGALAQQIQRGDRSVGGERALDPAGEGAGRKPNAGRRRGRGRPGG
jgi:hypothetical protein